jgi:hypothetical protein
MLARLRGPGMELTPMAVFLFRLETVEGKPARPSMLSAAVPNWRAAT